MTALSPDSVLTRSPRLSWRVLEGEAVVLFPEAGTLHRLNPTGTRCWELFDGTRNLGEVGECLVAEYDITPEAAVTDLRTLAAALVDADLVEVRA